MKRLNAYGRAERWYARQIRNGKLRTADYSALTKRSAICYEPAVMMSQRNEQTVNDLLQKAKALKAITDFKL